MKLAFVFPGQGAQYVGMGKDFYENHKEAAAIFDEADEVLGFSIKKICFEGPEEDLRLTFNTQPAILTMSVAINAVLEKEGIVPSIVAGHSLGEYSALVAAKAINFADAVKAVRLRGEFMQEAVPVGQGAMAAIMGIEDEKVVEICSSLNSDDNVVQAVNFNCPGQIVIAGSAKAVEEAVEKIKAAGAKRAMLLPVSAPFHSSLMKPAAIRLEEVLNKINFKNAQIPLYSNVTAKPVTDKEEIKTLLVKQAASPVLWTNLTKEMGKADIDAFVEVGPGKTLCGFAKKITPDIVNLNVGDLESLNKTINSLKEI